VNRVLWLPVVLGRLRAAKKRGVQRPSLARPGVLARRDGCKSGSGYAASPACGSSRSSWSRFDAERCLSSSTGRTARAHAWVHPGGCPRRLQRGGDGGRDRRSEPNRRRGGLRDAVGPTSRLRRTGARRGTFPERIRNRATRIFDCLRRTQTIEPTRKIPICRDFGQAAEGTRTLDLLHGNSWSAGRLPMNTENSLFPLTFHGPGLGAEW